MRSGTHAARRALGEDAAVFKRRHAFLTLHLSVLEDDDFVDEVSALVAEITRLSVRIELTRDLDPYTKPPRTGPQA